MNNAYDDYLIFIKLKIYKNKQSKSNLVLIFYNLSSRKIKIDESKYRPLKD